MIGLFALLCGPCSSASGQVDAGPSWLVLRYDISASVTQASHTLVARAQIDIRNVGRGEGSKITLRINSKAEIKSATINGATGAFRVSQDAQRNQQRVEVTIPSPVAPNSTFSVVIDYQLTIVANNQLAAISPLGSQFLPLSFWYPTPSNPLSARGGDNAPFRLNVTAASGETIVSAGKLNSGVFHQSLYGQPFFLSGSWEVSEGAGEAKGISAYLPKGTNVDERKQADALIALAGSARTYFANILGAAPDTPLRLIGVTRGGGFGESGTLLVDVAAFRRAKIDIVTTLQTVEMIARLWIGGNTPVRAESQGVIREGLVRHLAMSFIEKHFGVDAADAERLRQRTTYADVAKRDAPLTMMTPLDASYFTEVGNKGAMVWRLVEHALGRDVFFETLRSEMQNAAASNSALTLATLRQAFSSRGGEPLKQLLQYELDKPSDTDLLVGLPQSRGGDYAVALHNEGSMGLSTTVLAVTETGERLTTIVNIAAHDYAEAIFKTAGKIKRVEVDPEKLYPQIDYSNDVAPRQTIGDGPFVEAMRAFQRQEFARAENLLRDLLAAAPYAEEARVMLARTLLAQNNFDAAEKEFNAALALQAPTPVTLAWASIGLGEINLKRGQAAQAAKNFDEAVRCDADYATTLAARTGRLKAEAATKSPPAPDESARLFIAQLDKAILTGRKLEIEQMIVPGELTSFANGVVGSQPEVWQTQVLRTEQLDATRLAVDVNLNVKQLGRELSGRPVLILARVGGAWKLVDVEYFGEVR